MSETTPEGLGPVPVVVPRTAASFSNTLSFKDMLLKSGPTEAADRKLPETIPSAKVTQTAQVAEAAKVAEQTPKEEEVEESAASLEDIEKATATVHREEGGPGIHTLVLDAGPLLSQTFSELQGRARAFATTPAVLHTEVRDARARQNVALWQTAGALAVRQANAQNVAAVTEFARLTGDFAVLSTNDLHVLALARELDVELHGGSDAHLRRVPGKAGQKKQRDLEKANFRAPVTYNVRVDRVRPGEEEEEKEEEKKEEEDDGWAVVTKKSKNKRKPVQKDEVEELTSKMNDVAVTTTFEEEEDEDGWITQDNIVETMRKDQYEPDENSFNVSLKKKKSDDEPEVKTVTLDKFLPVAVSTGDFAMQNVALQMGLNLVSPVDGKYVRQVKSHMLRCHACFHLCPVPRTNDVDEIMERRRNDAAGKTKAASNNASASASATVLGRGLNFCPKCGAGNTLRRCTVRVDGRDGHIHVYLKRHMQWSTRGNVFQLPATQSRAARQQGRAKDPYHFGGTDNLILREDQKEYERALVHDWKQKRHNEKVLEEWIGGGDVSAGDVTVPFAYHRDAARHTGVKIGGRFNNIGRKK